MSRNESEIAIEVLAEAAVALSRSSYPTTHALPMIEDLAESLNRRAEVVLLPSSVVVEDRAERIVAIRKVTGSYNFNQMLTAQATIDELTDGRIPLAAARERLEQIPAQPPRFRPVWRVVGYGLVAVGFAMYLDMDPVCLALAAVLGLLSGAVVVAAGRSARMMTLMPATIAFGAALLVGLGARFADLPDPVRLGAIATVMLLPGAVLTSAVVELVGGDMVSGASRLLYAMMVLVSMAFAFVLGVRATGVAAAQLTDFRSYGSWWMPWLGVVVFTIGVMLYSSTPKGFYLLTLVVALLASGVQQAVGVFAPAYLAASVASAVALLAAWWINSRYEGGPVSMVLFLPAVWLLVPGSMAFVAVVGVIDHDARLSGLIGTLGLTLVGIAIGIMIASLIYPYRAHSPTRPKAVAPPGQGLH